MQKDTELGAGDQGPKGPKFCPQTQIKEEAYAINKITTISTNKEELSIWYGHSTWQMPSLGECPGIVSPSLLSLPFSLVRSFW